MNKDINYSINRYIYEKAKNKNAIRVIYKKPGQAPKIKIIDNIQKLKKTIITKKLEIIPYESAFIICKYKKPKLNVPINIFLPLHSIGGDLIVVNIDKKQREFKELSQDDLLWYTEDLIRKNANTKQYEVQNTLPKKSNKSCENNSSTPLLALSFENSLINILTNIEFALANMLGGKRDE